MANKYENGQQIRKWPTNMKMVNKYENGQQI